MPGGTGRAARRSVGGGLTSNNVVALNHRGHAHAFVIFAVTAIDTHHAAMRTHKYFSGSSNFGWQGKSEIELCTRGHVFGHDEIDAASRDVSGVPVMRGWLAMDGQTD